MPIASNRDPATTAKPEFMHLRTVAGAILFIAIAFKFLKHLPIWLLLLTAPVWLVIGIISCLCLEVAARWWYDNRVNAESDKQDQRPWTRRRPVFYYTPDVRYASSLGSESQEDMGSQGDSAVMTLLHIILNLIRQDFILPWYSRISTSNTFPEELDKTLLASISGLEERFKRLDIPQLLVARVLPHLTSHMHAYREVEPFLFPTNRTASSSQSTVDPAPILQSHRKTPLHPALPAPALANPMPSVESHLKRKVEVLLRAILPERDRQSKTVMIIAREVVTCAVMMPIVEMLADPDFWNRMLDQQADKHLQER
jgi:sorting nexin-25